MSQHFNFSIPELTKEAEIPVRCEGQCNQWFHPGTVLFAINSRKTGLSKKVCDQCLQYYREQHGQEFTGPTFTRTAEDLIASRKLAIQPASALPSDASANTPQIENNIARAQRGYGASTLAIPRSTPSIGMPAARGYSDIHTTYYDERGAAFNRAQHNQTQVPGGYAYPRPRNPTAQPSNIGRASGARSTSTDSGKKVPFSVTFSRVEPNKGTLILIGGIRGGLQVSPLISGSRLKQDAYLLLHQQLQEFFGQDNTPSSDKFTLKIPPSLLEIPESSVALQDLVPQALRWTINKPGKLALIIDNKLFERLTQLLDEDADIDDNPSDTVIPPRSSYPNPAIHSPQRTFRQTSQLDDGLSFGDHMSQDLDDAHPLGHSSLQPSTSVYENDSDIAHPVKPRPRVPDNNTLHPRKSFTQSHNQGQSWPSISMEEENDLRPHKRRRVSLAQSQDNVEESHQSYDGGDRFRNIKLQNMEIIQKLYESVDYQTFTPIPLKVSQTAKTHNVRVLFCSQSTGIFRLLSSEDYYNGKYLNSLSCATGMLHFPADLEDWKTGQFKQSIRGTLLLHFRESSYGYRGDIFDGDIAVKRIFVRSAQTNQPTQPGRAKDLLNLLQEFQSLLVCHAIWVESELFIKELRMKYPNPPPSPYITMNPPALALNIMKKPVATSPAGWLIERWLVGPVWRRYIRNDSSIIPTSDKAPEVLKIAEITEYLGFVQHIQWIISHGRFILSDFQGIRNTLSDPQLLTLEETTRFGPGNLSETVSNFPLEHNCGASRWCKHYHLDDDPPKHGEVYTQGKSNKHDEEVRSEVNI